MYDYRVVDVPRVIDGDTYDFDIDLGFYVTMRVRIRLADIDTYEVYGRNAHELGDEARRVAGIWLFDWLDAGALRVRTARLSPDSPTGDGSFGRWAGEVYNSLTNEYLADYLRERGLADE